MMMTAIQTMRMASRFSRRWETGLTSSSDARTSGGRSSAIGGGAGKLALSASFDAMGSGAVDMRDEVMESSAAQKNHALRKDRLDRPLTCFGEGYHTLGGSENAVTA